MPYHLDKIFLVLFLFSFQFLNKKISSTAQKERKEEISQNYKFITTLVVEDKGKT